MPAPTAASDEYVSSYRRRSHSPAAKTTTDAAAPNETRSPGPIHPRFTARTKKKTTPRIVTIPPAHASACAPKRSTCASFDARSNRGSRGGGGGVSAATRRGGGGGGAAADVSTGRDAGAGVGRGGAAA